MGKAIRKTMFCEYDGGRKSQNSQTYYRTGIAILRAGWLAQKTPVSYGLPGFRAEKTGQVYHRWTNIQIKIIGRRYELSQRPDDRRRLFFPGPLLLFARLHEGGLPKRGVQGLPPADARGSAGEACRGGRQRPDGRGKRRRGALGRRHRGGRKAGSRLHRLLETISRQRPDTQATHGGKHHGKPAHEAAHGG